MAKVYMFHEFGGPEVLRLEDAPVAAPGEGEVKVKIRTIGLNRADLTFMNNTYIKQAQLPSRLGYEAAGVILAVGKNVRGYSVGDEVCIIPPDDLARYGAYADEMLIAEKFLVHKPKQLSWEEASSVWMQFLTAWGGLVAAGQARAGEYILITAASNSVGIAAVQTARCLGAFPIATVQDGQWSDLLRGMGAAHVIEDSDSSANIGPALAEITGEEGLDLAFDAVGGPGIENIARALKKFGRIVIHGRQSPEPTPFPLKPAIRKSLSIQGYLVLELFNNTALLEAGKKFILDGLAAGALTPCIDKVFQFTEMREALDYFARHRRYGKVVVRVDA